MSASALLVDPLAALFRTDLVGLPPLLLDDVDIAVVLLGPLAHVTTVRRFTNTTPALVEAIMTLPPLAPGEVLHRLIVHIGGRAYEAHPRAAGRARLAHEAAVAAGRRAILYELIEHDIPLLAIAGIEAGARVEILTWSIRPLDRLAADRARLTIPLSAAREASLFRLGDADAAVTTRDRHAASITVSHAGLQVTISGQPYADKQIASGEATGVECSTPVALDIVPLEAAGLDHCAWHVDKPGGWEATTARGTETFRHPGNPAGSVASDRTDWIHGVIATGDGNIRVTAPLPSIASEPNVAGLYEIAPNARGLRALAAAGFVAAATPQSQAAVLLEANVLSRETSLVFVGPDGELPDAIPALRKVALAQMESIDWRAMADDADDAPPVALAPYTYEQPPPPPPVLPIKDQDHTVPGAKPPRYHWLTWSLVALAILAIAATFLGIGLSPLATLAAFFTLMLFCAVRFVPRAGTPGRRHLPWLLVLPIPWLAAVLAGPLFAHLVAGPPPITPDGSVVFQYGMAVLSALLPLLLLPSMGGARRFTLALGIVNFAVTLLAVAANMAMLTPGS